MRIIRNDSEATWTLLPTNLLERLTIYRIVNRLKPNDKIVYGGRNADKKTRETLSLLFFVGSKVIPQTRGRVTTNVREGGIKFTLKGTSSKDREEIGAIRDTCYFASGGLIFLSLPKVDGRTSILTTATHCKNCGARIIDMDRAEWRICASCVLKCEHQYKEGPTHGGGLNIGLDSFCLKCGTAKPKQLGERKRSVLEQHLAVEKELGVKIFYTDGPYETPKDVVQGKRLARKQQKAQSRRNEKF